LVNFRDAGGLRAADGRLLRPGLIFRAAELSRLEAADAETLEAHGVRLICDLRSPAESRKKPPGGGLRIPVVNVPLHDPAVYDLGFFRGVAMVRGDQYPEFIRGYYQHIAFERPARVREIVELLAQPERLPALIHCTAGKDRTGFVVALIQLMAGVPYELVRTEYLQTNQDYAQRREQLIRKSRWMTLGRLPVANMRWMLMAHGELLDAVYQRMMAEHGSAANYLVQACGVDGGLVQAWRERLLTSP
jgi:protein-tyrosine phosphatase